MKALKENLNPLVFMIGFVMLMVGLWQVSPHVAYITGGSVLMTSVVADSALRMVAKKGRGQ